MVVYGDVHDDNYRREMIRGEERSERKRRREVGCGQWCGGAKIIHVGLSTERKEKWRGEMKEKKKMKEKWVCMAGQGVFWWSTEEWERSGNKGVIRGMCFSSKGKFDLPREDKNPPYMAT